MLETFHVLNDIYSKPQFQFNIHNKHTWFYVLWEEGSQKEKEDKPKLLLSFMSLSFPLFPDKRAKTPNLHISC